MFPTTRSTPRRPRLASAAPCLEPLEPRSLLSTVLALTDSNSFVEFDNATPGTIARTVAITGLSATGRILAIDVRPFDGRLYGFFSDTSLFSAGICDIDPFTGAATNFRAYTVNVVVSSPTSIDFEASSNTLRLLSDPVGRVNRVTVSADNAQPISNSDAFPPTDPAAFINDPDGPGGEATPPRISIFTLDTAGNQLRRFTATEGFAGSETVVGTGLGVDPQGPYAAMDLSENGQIIAILKIAGIQRVGIIGGDGAYVDGGVLGNGALVIRDIAVLPYTAPSFTGAAASAITDKQTVSPLATLGITWLGNPAQSFDLEVTISPSNAGAFTPASLIASDFIRLFAAPNAYRFTGTSTAAVAAARILVFDPTENLAAVGQTATAFFAFALSDGIHPQIVAGGASVVSTSINDAPTDSAAANKRVNRNQSIRLYRYASVADPDPTQPLTVTVQANTAGKGFFTAANLAFAGFTKIGPRKIRFIGTAAAATTALQRLRFAFTPTLLAGPTQFVNFTLRASDGALGATNKVTRVTLAN